MVRANYPFVSSAIEIAFILNRLACPHDKSFAQFWSFILLFCAFGVSAAQAHNLNVFAISTGDTIEGYVYFTGGTRARAAEIELHADDGTVVAAARTDQNGAFAIRVSHRTPYVVQANTGDGHIATFTLTEDEFSENLPPAKNASDITARFVNDNTPDAAVAPTMTTPSSSATAPIGLKGPDARRIDQLDQSCRRTTDRLRFARK